MAEFRQKYVSSKKYFFVVFLQHQCYRIVLNFISSQWTFVSSSELRRSYVKQDYSDKKG